MGFKAVRNIYKLKFQDELAGLEVQARSVPTGTFLDVAAVAAQAERDLSKATALFSEFADALISWNVEDEDGKPVPADLDGVRSLEFGLAIQIIRAWLDAMGGISAPLEPSSTSGASSPVASLPMDPL